MIKTFDPSRDVKEQPTEVTELISYGGSIFSGATVGTATQANIKRFNQWASASNTGSLHHTMYSTNFTASNAVSLMSLAYGYSISSSFYGATNETNGTEKNRMYKLFAKQLLGSQDDRFVIDSLERDELVFLSLHRTQRKDELRKSNISFLAIGSGSNTDFPATEELVYTDTGAANDYDVTIRGDVSDIKSGSLVVGKVWYQAGILALIPEKFSNTSSVATNGGNLWSGSHDYESMALSGGGGTLDNTLDAMRFRFRNMSIMNSTQLHASLYFCRALNDEFNYSSNPTFIDVDGRILPTSGSTTSMTKTYITKVGLLGANNELLAVGSLSQPLKKAPDIERTVVVRLDY